VNLTLPEQECAYASEMPADRLVRTQSWSVVCQLMRRHPELKLVEMQPGAGGHFYLTLLKDKQILVRIAEDGQIADTSVAELVPPDENLKPLAELERSIGIDSPVRHPASTPSVLAFRVIAQLMAVTLDDRRRWDVRHAFCDAPDGGAVVRKYVNPFPVAVERAGKRQSDDPYLEPWARFWAVLRASEPVALLDTDGFVYVGRQVLYLPELYAAHSRRLTPTVAAALGSVLP
jgi:hypothetical protein